MTHRIAGTLRIIPRAGTSFVLAVYAQPFDYASLPFVVVADLLEKMMIPVPGILDQAADLGILALQDLGDVTLQAHVGTAPAADHTALYHEAVALITTIQARGREVASPALLPFTRAFDTHKLTWELEFFVSHFLEAYRGIALEPTARTVLSGEFDRLVRDLAAESRVLCHRDFHSRNLMLHGDRLVVIDFQDARLGPDTYDLVSLLRDSYADLTADTVEDLIDEFRTCSGATESRQAFRQRFDAMALQRNLKALGMFGYQTAVRRNPVYLQYIPRTLRYVRDTLCRHRQFARLQQALAVHLPELR